MLIHICLIWNSYPSRLRSKGFQISAYGHLAVAANQQNLITFYNQAIHDDIDVFGTVFIEGTPVHLEAIPLRPASRDIIR